MKLKKIVFALLLASSYSGYAQENNGSTAPPLHANATLTELIEFALSNRIEIKQANLDKEIGEREIASALSGWFPQINATGNLIHNLQLPTAVIGGSTIAMGQKNTSGLTFQVDQSILSPELFQASKAARFIRQQNNLTIEDTRINTIVDVSKAYYDILTSEEQINIIQENISRLERQYSDANARYETGLVDKTDYKRAQISLNNAKAELKSTKEMRNYKYDYLKMLLGMKTQNALSLSFENQDLAANILLDSTTNVNIANRVEFRQLANQQQLQKLNTQYQKWNFLPKIGAYANYALNYRNDKFGDLYSNNFPASAAGLTLSLPIFQGTKRVQELRKSQLMEDRLSMDMQNLENQINTQYSAAMATYRANMNDWKNSKENMELSEEVYNTIKLQYDAGLKTYLELMASETDLKTSQLNYLNSMYAVLSSKLDIQKALGTVESAN